jgi:hypothetical protein
MTLINDPDNLDRFQVIVDPYYKIISLRGSGSPTAEVGGTQGSAGSGTLDGKFCDTTNNFTNVFADPVSGDILAVVNDPDSDGGVMGHYKISSKVGDVLTLDRAIGTTSQSGVSYRVYVDGYNLNTTGPSLASGVTMQSLYSFLKEEWRENSLSASGEDLIKYTFPMVSITSEQFEIGGVSNSNWEFADNSGGGSLSGQSPRNLIRTGGWASINNSGVIIENYPSIITLGSLGVSSQVYYQLTSATTNPDDFVLTGTVNQSIRTLETVGGASTTGNKQPVSGVNGSIVFVSASDSANANGEIVTDQNLYQLGFNSGELIQVRQSTNNNGFFTIVASGGTVGSSGVLVSEAVTTESASAAVVSPMTDNRDYLVLRVRTKGQSYAQSEIADIGVSQINTIVNRFPLAESSDPAITLDDGVINGDGGVANAAFQSVSTTESNTTATVADQGDGTFTLTQSGATFNTASTQLYAGDTVEITAATTPSNVGVYEIKSVDSNTQLTLINEPLRGAITNEGSISFTARSRVRDEIGSQAGTVTDTGGEVASGGVATLSDTGAFANVVAGDIVVIESATPAIEGFYKVASVTDNDNIKITVKATNSDDANSPYDNENFGGLSAEAVTYTILEKGMHLGYKSNTSTEVVASTNNFSYSTNVITAAGNDFAADGYYVGSVITLAGTSNDGTYIVTARTATTLTVINTDGTTPTLTGGPDSGGTATINGTYGFVRKVSDVEYSFNWKLLGNGGTLGECFQFLQKQLRQITDIDETDNLKDSGSTVTFRGDITDLLMTFASPNGTTLNLFIDDLAAADSNNVTFQDSTDTNRNNPFIVALRIALNNNILNSAKNKIVVFYTDKDTSPGNGDEFGTTGAEVVADKDGNGMSMSDFTTLAGSGSPLTFQYDHSADGDAAITIVAISDTAGQYVSTTASLTAVNTVDASLVAGLERNYSNP